MGGTGRAGPLVLAGGDHAADLFYGAPAADRGGVLGHERQPLLAVACDPRFGGGLFFGLSGYGVMGLSGWRFEHWVWGWFLRRWTGWPRLRAGRVVVSVTTVGRAPRHDGLEDWGFYRAVAFRGSRPAPG